MHAYSLHNVCTASGVGLCAVLLGILRTACFCRVPFNALADRYQDAPPIDRCVLDRHDLTTLISCGLVYSVVVVGVVGWSDIKSA